MIVRIQEGTTVSSTSNNQRTKSTNGIAVGNGSSSTEQLQLSGRITAVFHVPALICGIASFGDDICLQFADDGLCLLGVQ